MVKKWKLRRYGHISRSSRMAKVILQDRERSKKETKTKEEMGRQHQGMDRNGVWRFQGQRKTGKVGNVLLQCRTLWYNDEYKPLLK